MIGLFPVIGIPPLSLCNVFAEHPGKLLGMCASQWTSSELLETGSELALQNQKNLVSSRLLLPMLQKINQLSITEYLLQLPAVGSSSSYNFPLMYFWMLWLAISHFLSPDSPFQNLPATGSYWPVPHILMLLSAKKENERRLLFQIPLSVLLCQLCSIPRTCLRSKKECSFCYKAMSVLLPCRKRTAAKKESLQNSCRTQHEISFMAAKNSSFARFENTSCRSYQVAG